MLGKFLSCRERFRLKYVLGLEPMDKWNHRFGYGNMWHVCEETLAKSEWEGDLQPVESTLRLYTKEQIQKYPLQQEEITKWYNVCKVQFPEYVTYWQDHSDVKNRTPLLQEQVFDVPYILPSGRVVRLRGRWDSVDLITDATDGLLGRHRQETSGIYLQENKTKGEVDKLQIERQLNFDMQTLFYLIALDKEAKLQPHGSVKWFPQSHLPICGVRFNVVRRPLSGGVGNIKPHSAKYTKTKTTPAETEEQFYERLRRDYIAKDPGHWFFRVRAEISTQDIQVFRDTCLDPLLEQVCWWYEQVTHRYLSFKVTEASRYPPMNYRTPFGVWNSLTDGGITEYDAFLASGSEAGLRRTEELFTELK